jgi:hypothetical protein
MILNTWSQGQGTTPESNKRRVKRGPRKKKSPEGSKPIKIYYNNINGYQSKKSSLHKIINETAPDIIALCETKKGVCTRKKKKEIAGYEVVERNTKKRQGGHDDSC